MSGFLKRFGGGSGSKDKKPGKSHKDGPPKSPTDEEKNFHLANGFTEEEAKYAGNGKRERNLSISRSGKHKMKNKQRISVMQGDVFNGPSSPETSPQGQGQTNGYGSRTGAGAGVSSPWTDTPCRDREGPRAPRQAMTSAPTAV